MQLVLKKFNEDRADIIRPWFDDATTSQWLGDRSWVDNVFRLQNEVPGTEFRGAKRISYYAYVAYGESEPVGFVDAGVVDKYVKYGGESNGKPIILASEDKVTAAISFVINPQRRGKRYATGMIKSLLRKHELAEVRIFEAGVEPENKGSIKALEAAGFISDYQPDFEGICYFQLRR